MQIMENKGSPGILITELKKLRSCAKCIKKPTLITESEISKMFKNVDNSEGSVDTMDKTKTRIVNNTVAELEINPTTKKTTAEVQCKEDNSTRKKLNANEPITEEPPKTPTKQVYQNTDIDMLCTPRSLNRKKIALARRNKFNDSLTPGWIKAAFSENRILEHGRLQYMGSKQTEDGYIYKFIDSKHCSWNIVAHGKDINEALNDLEPLSIIKISESYKQGFCIIIVSFDLLEARPGFLLMNTETNNVEYITKEFIMDIAKAKGGLDGDGRPNSKSD